MALDFLFVFLIIFSVFWGYRKGFTQMLLSCAVFLFSIILVAGIYNYLGDVLLESSYAQSMLNTAAHGIEEHLVNGIESKVPFLQGLFKSAAEGNSPAFVLARKAVESLMAIPLIIISFVVLKILIFALRRIISKTTSLPVIGGIDSMLGAVCGLATGVIMVTVLYFVLAYIQFLPSLEVIKEQFESSLIVILINDIL